MDKATFLVELQRNIGMLDDAEQRDIIDEYAQHIDMKVSDGMTEAEAIEDFGDFKDFVRDVLSAYHVKAPFDQAGTADSAAEPARGDKVREATERMSAATKRGVSGLSGIAKTAAGKLSKAAKTVGKSCSAAGDDPALDDANPHSSSGAAGKLRIPASGFMGKVWALAKTCVRWIWNAVVALVVATLVCSTLFFIFAVGLGAVLLVQGYPLVGATIASAGGAAASAALTYLATRCIVRKKPANLSGGGHDGGGKGGQGASDEGKLSDETQALNRICPAFEGGVSHD